MFPLIKYSVLLLVRAVVFGICAGLLTGSFAGFENQVVVSIQFLAWAISLYWIYRLYRARKSVGLVHLRVKDDKIGISLPMQPAKWFPATNLTEASNYVTNSSLRGISAMTILKTVRFRGKSCAISGIR